MKEIIVCCTHCGRKLNKSKAVMLEFNQRTNLYSNFVPVEESQGGFWFGKDCAKKILLLKEQRKLEKLERKITINDLRKAVRKAQQNLRTEREYIMGLEKDAPEREQLTKQEQEKQHQKVVSNIKKMLKEIKRKKK